MTELQKELLKMKDEAYKASQAHILPSVKEDRILGIRSAKLIKFAKEFFKNKSTEPFLKQLPHKYFEEDLIHAWILSKMKDYDECLRAVNAFLPYVDNWALCDSLIPKIFNKHTDELHKEIKIWLNSEATYTLRFAISMLMKFYLKKNYDKKYLKWAADVRSKEYYVEMMSAWFFTEALIMYYDDAVVFLRENLLTKKIHTKTIQKAVDSLRLPEERKEYLKTLRGRKI